MDYHLLRSFTLAMHVPPHDKTLENHITFPKESENTTLSTCKHCCLNRECAEYTIYYYQCIETSRRLRFKSKLSRTSQKKTGKQTYTDYVVLAIWAIGGQSFGRPVVKMVANATGRVLILLPAHRIKPYLSNQRTKEGETELFALQDIGVTVCNNVRSRRVHSFASVSSRNRVAQDSSTVCRTRSRTEG